MAARPKQPATVAAATTTATAATATRWVDRFGLATRSLIYVGCTLGMSVCPDIRPERGKYHSFKKVFSPLAFWASPWKWLWCPPWCTLRRPCTSARGTRRWVRPPGSPGRPPPNVGTSWPCGGVWPRRRFYYKKNSFDVAFFEKRNICKQSSGFYLITLPPSIFVGQRRLLRVWGCLDPTLRRPFVRPPRIAAIARY